MINRLKPAQCIKITPVGVMVAVHNSNMVKTVVLLKDGGVMPEHVSFIGEAYHLRGNVDWKLSKAQSETIEELCRDGWRLMRPQAPERHV